jgi:hypothetical protein
MKIRKRTKRILYGTLCSLFLTGSCIFVLNRWVKVQGPFGEEHHPAQAWVTRAHMVFAYGALISLGYLGHSHIRVGLKGSRAKPTGMGIIAVFAILAASSWVVLYASEGWIRTWGEAVHTWLGLTTPLFLFLHLLPSQKRPTFYS